MYELTTLNKYTHKGITSDKSQIILCNSFRNSSDYINSLRYRMNKKYSKIPHFFITRDGKVYNFLDELSYSEFFENLTLARNSITIVLENLGWLEKIPLTSEYINWIGDIYKKEIYERKWRDYFFWEPYSQIQIEKTAELCLFLIEKHKIKNKCVGHNTKIEGIENFRGIFSKSNIHEDYTDLSPAFDFKLFENYLKNEPI